MVQFGFMEGASVTFAELSDVIRQVASIAGKTAKGQDPPPSATPTTTN